MRASGLTWSALLPALLLSASLAAQSPSTGTWITARPGADPGAADAGVRLRLVATPEGVQAIADNPLAGPVEVLLRAAGATAPRSDPALPARATVPARGSVVVAHLFADHDNNSSLRSRTALHLQAVPGAPCAQPRDLEYRYPLRDARVQVTQGVGGGFSHADAENWHAVDFAAPEGTPVLAARDGTVMQIEARVAGTAGASLGDNTARTNFIRILHDDGTMGLYAHLQYGGVVVAPGARVARGSIIGFSGNTGASTGPHLHFVVQANHGLRLVSVPFRMFGPGGILRFDAPPTPQPF